MLRRTGFEIYLSQAAWTRACGSAIVVSAPLPISAALYSWASSWTVGHADTRVDFVDIVVLGHDKPSRQHAQPVAENEPRHPQLAFPLFLHFQKYKVQASSNAALCLTSPMQFLVYQRSVVNAWYCMPCPCLPCPVSCPAALLHV